MAALIVIAVIVIIIAFVLSVSATFTVTYTDKWKTTISVLWIEKEIQLTKILDFILFPQNKANQVKAQKGSKEKKKTAKPQNTQETPKPQPVTEDIQKAAEDKGKTPEIPAKKPQNTDTASAQKQPKPNYFKNIWDKDGIVGIMDFFSNMVESASSAISVLIKGFHIYSLYVKIIIGGSDADEIARAYGRVCKYYYPLKGAILGGMKVDNYDDLITPDFIAPRNEYGFQFIGSISVGLLLKVALSAGKTFLVNLIKNNNNK